jgi:hypothetical protein
MSDKVHRVPERLQDMREAIANARDDLGALTKDEFLPDCLSHSTPPKILSNFKCVRERRSTSR